MQFPKIHTLTPKKCPVPAIIASAAAPQKSTLNVAGSLLDGSTAASIKKDYRNSVFGRCGC